MQETENNNFEDQINIKELANILWQGKHIIASITIFVSIFGLIYSLLLPNIYTSSAILSPTDSSSSISKSLQSYAGLAGLAGINLPSNSEDNNAAKGIQKLNSLSFFENSIMPNIYLPNLMALRSWDHKTNNLNYKNKDYDKKTETWIRDYSYPQKQIPSAQESFEVFKEKHFTLVEDKKTGFISLNISHKSPFIAKKWVELMISEINTFYRQKDKADSSKAITYLNEQIALTNLSEVKEAISKIIEDETRKLALIEAKEYYVFDYIDTPAAMEEKSEPKRALICIISFLIGFFISLVFVLVKYHSLKKDSLI